MKTILLANQKGGVGKTTIADELAYALERRGYTVAYVDMDEQGGATHKTNLAETPDADYCVIDTAGQVTKAIRELILGADIVLVPTRPSARDIASTSATVTAAAENCDNVAVVLNCYNPRATADKLYLGTASSLGWQVIAAIPESEVIDQAPLMGCSAYEINKRNKAAIALDELADKVTEILEA